MEWVSSGGWEVEGSGGEVESSGPEKQSPELSKDWTRWMSEEPGRGVDGLIPVKGTVLDGGRCCCCCSWCTEEVDVFILRRGGLLGLGGSKVSAGGFWRSLFGGGDVISPNSSWHR